MSEARFMVRLICCGRDDGTYGPVTWDEADKFRDAYCSGPGVLNPSCPEKGGHERAGIIYEASL